MAVQQTNHTDNTAHAAEHTSLGVPAHMPSIAPETVFHIGSFPVANTTLMLVATIFIVGLTIALLGKLQLVPRMFQNVLESLYELIEGLLAQLLGSESKAKQAVPILGSIFVFIGLSNLLGLVPGISSFTYNGVHIFRSATSDFNTTLGLALGAVIAIQFIGFKHNGLFGYLGHFIKIKSVYTGFKKSIGDGFIGLIELFVGLLELVGEVVKIVSLSLRLFGNMFAGKVLMTILLTSCAYVLPALWLGMELLVAVVQALVFGSLVTVYYSLVTADDTH